MSDPETAILFSDEQAQLLETAEAFARDKFPMEHVRGRIAAAEDFDPSVWREMAALGWLGVAVDEAFGGSGLGLGEVVAIVEPLGRHLAGAPFMSTTLAAQALMRAGSEAQKRQWLPKLCEGAVGALALTEPHGDWNLENLTTTVTENGDTLMVSGTKTFVTDAASADIVIASALYHGAPALVLLEKAMLGAARIEREIVVDETRRSYRIDMNGVAAPKSALFNQPETLATLAHIDHAACLLLAAEMCGATGGVIAATVEYLRTRKQFDRPIGSYQALKHPMVDALIAYEGARSHLYHAAGMFGQGVAGEIAVRMAKAMAGDALAFASDRAIQFHGGFGFTYDCDAHLYRRRGLWCEAQHGDAAYQRRRLANLIF
jgi:alkylation response protein AidB-like acyl-CoA dehydrogenase